ncbi:MAG: FAD-dependent oxidoreductase [Porticoccaceae bacterium]
MGNNQWDTECDILVVGSGAGGLTAAVVAADRHAETLVVEKGERFGGTSATSGAVLWIPLSHLAEAAGAQDSPQEAFTYIKALAGDDAADDLIQTFIARGREMLRYMVDNSDVAYKPIPYPDYRSEQPGGKSGWRSHDCVPLDGRLLGGDLDHLERPHVSNMLFGRFVWNSIDASKLVTRTPGWIGAMLRTLWRHYSDVGQRLRSSQSRYLTGGNALIGRLKLSLDKRGVPLWLNTTLLELVSDDHGRVSGAIVEREGRRLAVKARRAVILAAGGFEHSPGLRARHLPASPNTEWSGAQGNNTGDAMVAALGVGAGAAMLDSAWRAPVVRVPGEDRARPLFIERSLPGAIIVNQAGNRYMNEAVDYHCAGQAMIDNAATGTCPSFILFDSLFKWRYPMGPVLPIIPIWMHPKAVRQILVQARDWDEMARKLNIDPAALKATIDRFNANARQGRDPDFHRGETLYERIFGDQKLEANPSLTPLAKAPFYALPVYPGDIGTNGGLRIGINAEVLDSDGQPIPGLYATGNITASVMGRGYPGGGATIGPAMTFGYLAARHAAPGDTAAEA